MALRFPQSDNYQSDSCQILAYVIRGNVFGAGQLPLAIDLNQTPLVHQRFEMVIDRLTGNVEYGGNITSGRRIVMLGGVFCDEDQYLIAASGHYRSEERR